MYSCIPSARVWFPSAKVLAPSNNVWVPLDNVPAPSATWLAPLANWLTPLVSWEPPSFKEVTPAISGALFLFNSAAPSANACVPAASSVAPVVSFEIPTPISPFSENAPSNLPIPFSPANSDNPLDIVVNASLALSTYLFAPVISVLIESLTPSTLSAETVISYSASILLDANASWIAFFTFSLSSSLISYFSIIWFIVFSSKVAFEVFSFILPSTQPFICSSVIFTGARVWDAPPNIVFTPGNVCPDSVAPTEVVIA